MNEEMNFQQRCCMEVAEQENRMSIVRLEFMYSNKSIAVQKGTIHF
jgi:hypothetical protein